jgi:hypothetical protein
MENLNSFQAESAAIALKKLLYGNHFSICDFDKLAKLLEVEVGGKDYEALQAIHCVHWADMPEHYRQAVRDTVVRLLGVPPVIIEGEVSSPSVDDPKTQSKGRSILPFLRRNAGV